MCYNIFNLKHHIFMIEVILMNGKKEDNFKINGMEYWIQCIHFNEVKSNVEKSRPSFEKPDEYHYHEYIELLYFYKGDGYVWVNDTCSKITDKLLVVINSNQAHDVILYENSNYICIKFSPHILYNNEPFFLDLKYALPFMTGEQQYAFCHEDIKETPINSLLDEIMNEWHKMEFGFELAIRSNILKIFLFILRIWNEKDGRLQKLNLSNQIKYAIEYISNNYNTVTEKEVAKVCNFSYNYFSRIFKEEVGKSFKDYVVNIKLKEAEKLLITSKMSITEIAEETGFSSISHFILRFKEFKGLTPEQFRKQIS